MKNITKYYFLIIGFFAGFILSLVGVTVEDFQHNIPMREALTSFHHYFAPILTGFVLSMVGYLYWKIKSYEVSDKKKLIENQIKVNTMISNSSDVIAIINNKGFITYQSSNVTFFFGWLPEELDQKNYLENVHSKDYERVKHALNNLFRDENKSCKLRLEYKCKNGLYKPIQLTAINLTHNKNIKGILCNYQDITEHLEHERASINNEYQFRALFENMIDIVTMLDNDKRIIDVNPAAIELLEYSKEELLDMTIDQLIFQGDKAKSDEYFNKLQNTGSYAMYEGRVITKSGKIKWLQVNSTKYIKDGKCIGSQDIGRDITQQKEVEIELEKTLKELEKINIDKDRLLSILAHDLKSPFNSILGFLNLLSNNIREYSIDEIEEYVNIINNSTQNTYNLLIDILTWVKANSGKIPYEPQILGCNDICEEVIENLNLAAKIKNIKIIPPELNEIILFADKNLLEAVLRNLISNAIKFTHEGGNVQISIKADDSNASITVSDNGVGMTDETIKKIFDISQTYTTKGTAEENGTGFGLLLCQEFIELNGGKIWIESELGKGSHINFTTSLFIDQEIVSRT